MFKRVTLDPKILHGEPCIRGMRIPVHLVVSLVAAGMTVPEIIDEYPDLEPQDIRAALDYAAYVTREQVIPLEALGATAHNHRTRASSKADLAH